jgi:hypothetical protein
MPPRVPRGASPPPRTKESLVHGRAQTSGVIIVALTQVLNPRHTRNRGARARCRGASARRSRTHTAMRSRGDRHLRSSLRLPRPLAPSSSGPMAPAPHKTVRHSLRRTVWRTQGHSASCPPSSAHPVHTEDFCAPFNAPHTPAAPPSFSAGPALVTYSTAHAGLCGTHTPRAHSGLRRPRRSKRAHPPACLATRATISHARAVQHTLWATNTRKPSSVSPAPPAARAHTRSPCARGGCRHPPACPPCLAS